MNCWITSDRAFIDLNVRITKILDGKRKNQIITWNLEARSTKMWYIRTYAIMMCQHIDAWYAHQKDELSFLNGHIFSSMA